MVAWTTEAVAFALSLPHTSLSENISKRTGSGKKRPGLSCLVTLSSSPPVMLWAVWVMLFITANDREVTHRCSWNTMVTSKRKSSRWGWRRERWIFLDNRFLGFLALAPYSELHLRNSILASSSPWSTRITWLITWNLDNSQYVGTKNPPKPQNKGIWNKIFNFWDLKSGI